MEKLALPAGLTAQIKAATRELCLAVEGTAVVQRLTGLSPGVISRCKSDAYADVMSLTALAALEFHAQVPVLARLLADLVGVAASGADVTSALGEALADGVVTPGEATAVQAAIGRHERQLASAKRRLAVVVGGR